MTKEISYLAIPYTQFPELSFNIANEVTAKLMLEGKVVFSPISMSHNLVDWLPKEVRNSNDFWMKFDKAILSHCSELIVVLIGSKGQILVDESKGCQGEIQYAINNNIPIKYFNYDYECK